jgi:hypothetical protein
MSKVARDLLGIGIASSTGGTRGEPALVRPGRELFLILLNVATFKYPGPTQRMQALTNIKRYIGISVRAAGIIDANGGIVFSA